MHGLPAGLIIRPLLMSDARAATELVAACELHDDGQVEIDESDILTDWRTPSLDLAAHTVGVRAGENLVAYGHVFKFRRAEVYVHPGHRGRGIGSSLIRWTWDIARLGGGTLVGQTVTDNDLGAADLFRALGYEPLWLSWILSIESTDRPVLFPTPDDVTLRDFVPGQEDREVFDVVERAFSEWPDRDPSTFADWAAHTIGRDGFEPWRLPLAVSGGQVVGAAYLLEYAGIGGWVQQIAVVREHRGRGVGKALLAHSFAAFWDRGHRTFELSTDSRTGALELYEYLGMRVRRSYTHWAKSLVG